MNKIGPNIIAYDGCVYTLEELEDWFTMDVEDEIKKALDSLSSKTIEGEKILSCVRNNLHEILLMKPHDIELRVQCINKSYSDVLEQEEEGGVTLGKMILDAFNYKKWRKSKLVELAMRLNVKTCPYCNMHYTLFADEGKYKKDRLAKLQFDHFYDKHKYPMFSMSLYNLIPSCAVCNQGKSTTPVSLKFNPYVSSVSELFNFRIKNDDDLKLRMGAKIRDKIGVELVPKACTQDEIDVYDNVFHLSSLYGRHQDIAQEVFDKVYLEQYYKMPSSFRFFNGAKRGDYWKRLIYGVYISDDDLSKRPMSKFIRDIREQALNKKDNENI